MNFSTIQFHPGPRIASIVLDRPPLNIINLEMLDEFNAAWSEVEDLKSRYRAGKVGDVEVKTKLARALNDVLEPMRERRREALARRGWVREILFEGSARAGRVAAGTLVRVRDAMKVRYR